MSLQFFGMVIQGKTRPNLKNILLKIKRHFYIHVNGNILVILTNPKSQAQTPGESDHKAGSWRHLLTSSYTTSSSSLTFCTKHKIIIIIIIQHLKPLNDVKFDFSFFYYLIKSSFLLLLTWSSLRCLSHRFTFIHANI